LFEKLVAIQKQVPPMKGVIAFETSVLLDRKEIGVPVFGVTELWNTPLEGNLEQVRQNIGPQELASIIYTSGTTGHPKGVMLTHSNFIHNVILCQETLKMNSSDKHLSFLPLCHVFERTAGHYLMVHLGATIAYAENLDTVPQNITETRPTFLLGVPRFFEKVQTRVMEAVHAANPLRQGLFAWARELGRRKRMGEKTGPMDRLLTPIAELLVYRKFKQRLGGRLRFCVSGGAALSKEIGEFFCDLGIMIYEGYGLTETSPVISVNREGRYRFGSVGIPLRAVELKITEEGEIATRSACVMKGYYQKPAETAEVLKDGWFYTGDLGRLDSDGFLIITGRKKEILVTSGGKKVAPRPIEELLEKDPYILRCVLYGEGKKCISALIVPKEGPLTEHAIREKIEYRDYPDLLRNQKIIQCIDARVQTLMKDFAPYEQIKFFALLAHDFSQASGELTPTLKVKRDTVYARYKDLLAPFYEIER
jgi:long-chain acyl-CoA synthetase